MANAGDLVRASDTARYYFQTYQSSTQSVAVSTYTPIQYNGTDAVDNLGVHDPVTNNSRAVIGLAIGWWLIYATYCSTTTATANKQRRINITLNGSGVLGATIVVPNQGTAAGSFWTVNAQTLVQTTASTDYVEAQAFHDEAAPLSTAVSSGVRSILTGLYLGT